MRSFPQASQSSYYAQFSPTDHPRTNHRASMSTNPDDISRIKSDAVEYGDLSSASIESELKRIESFFSAETRAFLKDMGPGFGQQNKQRDSAEFQTASFNSREKLKMPNLTKVETKMPALFEVEQDNCQLEDSNTSSLYGLGEQTSEDLHGQSVPLGGDLSISATIKKYQDILRNQERINMSLQSEVEDQLDTFGIKKYPQVEVKGLQSNWERGRAMPALTEAAMGNNQNPHANVNINTYGNANANTNANINPNTYANVNANANERRFSKQVKVEPQPVEQYTNEEQSSNDSTMLTSKRRDTSPRSITETKRVPSFRTLHTEPESYDVDYYLKHLMIPRRMKISIGGVPFQEVIFVLALKFFDKSPYFENFVFEWLDVQTSEMIGYIKCDYIKFVHKQAQKRFNIACKEPKNDEIDEDEEEILHHVHIEADSPAKCELYVNGLNAIIKFMEKSIKASGY